MALQSSNLVMVGLGTLDDAPPVVDQPRLVDGAHLRWSVPRSIGFPWYGFYLYRRPSYERYEQVCLASALGRRPFASDDSQVPIGDGWLSGTAPLSFTDDFSPSGRIEVDLRGQASVRFDRPATNPMHHLHITIAFRETRSRLRCVDFGELADLVRLPLKHDGLSFAAIGRAAQKATRAAISRDKDGTAMLTVDGPLEATLPELAELVELDFDGAGGAVLIEAFDARGVPAGQTRSKGRSDGLLRMSLKGKAITRLRLTASGGLLKLSRLCFGFAGKEKARSIRVEALDRLTGLGIGDSVVVGSALASGNSGDVVTVELPVSRATGLRIEGGDAALIDLCWSEVERKLQGKWEPVPECRQPLTLPVIDPDYPAWQGAPDQAQAKDQALGRIRYGLPDDWDGEPFDELHAAVERLVAGGPAAGPMDAPERGETDIAATPLPGEPKTPGLTRLHPLDTTMLGSLHPPIAEMLGLAWTDKTIPAQTACDYMVVADRDGVSYGDPSKLLIHLANNGFDAGTDAWIVYGLRVEKQPSFPSPQDVIVYALPGGPMTDSSGKVGIVAGSTALDWPRGISPIGWIDAASAVVHHVYRSKAGTGAVPAVPSQARTWLTKNRPLLNARPVAAPMTPTSTPPGWPPSEPAFLDLRLTEGWYVYQAVAVDIFGRFSPKSPFAAWWQWAPPPTPPPWYYSGSAAKVVHPKAVRVLDKTRPPIPVGLEAFVLDPNDPILIRDAAYTAWRAGLGAATVGLRVRWRWSPDQQKRAPKVSEFRLYWSGGSSPPPSWAEPAEWPDRFFVCPYGSSVTADADGTRRYDMFLPQPGGGPLAGGVPLAPDVANPVAYANVSITASDPTAESADRWPGGGPFGARDGNESQCAPPQRVFRVHRAAPPPPEALVDGPRVYTTPANWHGRSFHTHRWKPRPSLFAHVWRAIDEAVFETDWAAQPRAALTTVDPAFPDAAAEPIWNNAKKSQVAAEIDSVGALLPAAPSAAQKAAKKSAAFALYRALSDDALRVLANRAGNEKAFVQVTTRQLSAADAPDRRGPDDTKAYAPSALRCAYVDEVDGRASNRLLYRTLFVDAAQNRSALGPCGTVVRLPDVVAPRPPAIAKAVGGDRKVTLTWISNLEPDLAEYRVFRVDSEVAARDIRTMSQVAALAVDPVPANRPPTVQWTDEDVVGLKDFWYRVAAVDRVDPDPRGGGGNLSTPSPAIRVRAFDDTPPAPPAITAAAWVRVDQAGAVFPYADAIPPGAVRDPAVQLGWPDPGADIKVLVQAKGPGDGGFRNISGWLAPGTTGFVGRFARPFEPLDLRLKVVNAAGNANSDFLPTSIDPA